MPTKRLPKHFWSDCLLEAMTGIDINQLATHHGRVLQINDCRRHDYARSRGQIILKSQTASASASKSGANNPDTSTSTPAIVFLGPTLEAVERSPPEAASHLKSEGANAATSNSSKTRNPAAKNTAGRAISQTDASATNSTSKTSTEPTTILRDNHSVKCPICHTRMREDEVAAHIDRNHNPGPPQGQFEDLPITTPIDQLPAYVVGRRDTHSRVPQVPILSVPVYGFTATPWEWQYPPLFAPVSAPSNARPHIARSFVHLAPPPPAIPVIPPLMTYLHVCITCGNVRSPGFHRENPLLPGHIPQPSECRRCTSHRVRDDQTSESNNSEDNVKVAQSELKSATSKTLRDNKDTKSKSKSKSDKELKSGVQKASKVNKFEKLITDKKPIPEGSGHSNSKNCNSDDENRFEDCGEDKEKGRKGKVPCAKSSIDSMLAELSLSDNDDEITIIRLPRKRKPKERMSNLNPEVGEGLTRSVKNKRQSDHTPNSHTRQPQQNSYPLHDHKSRTLAHTDLDDFTSSESSFTRHIRRAGWHNGVQHVPARVTQSRRIPHGNPNDFTPDSDNFDHLPPSVAPTHSQYRRQEYIQLPDAPAYSYQEYATYHNQLPFNPPYPTSDDESDRRSRTARHVHFYEDEMMSGGREPAPGQGSRNGFH